MASSRACSSFRRDRSHRRRARGREWPHAHKRPIAFDPPGRMLMTKGRVTRRRVEIVLALACLLVSGPAAAQSAAEFYRGKQIDMYIGTPTGGGYDQYGRLLGRHMSRHIPGNPMIVY